MRKINRLNEEIARWAFEIIIKKNKAWTIAFTNPTAGPWKTIKSSSLITAEEGEVYRFPLEEDRPDIIIYNDDIQLIIIFEAKDSLEKLLDIEQAKKSVNVVLKLASILKSKAKNEFWKGRENYKVILGLLWGSVNKPKTQQDKQMLYDCYYNLSKNKDLILFDFIIGVETLYKDEQLSCTAFFKDYSGYSSILGNKIIASLNNS